MHTVKLVNMLYYLGSDAKELDRNSFLNIEEAVLEAQRVASTLKHPIPIFLLLNGISVKIAIVNTDESVCYDSNIFTDGEHTINTIIALVDEFEGHDIANASYNVLFNLAESCEYTVTALTEQDYSELLGEDFIKNVKDTAGNNSDAAFKYISRIDNIIDTHNLQLSNIEVKDVNSLMNSYDYTINKDIDKSNELGLVSLYKTLGIYFNRHVQI